MIGSDVTLLCAMNGCSVIMLGRTEESLQRGFSRIRKNLQGLIAEGVYTPQEADQIVDSIHTETRMPEAVRDADFVLEGIIEDLDVKQEFFAQLDQHCPPSYDPGFRYFRTLP